MNRYLDADGLQEVLTLVGKMIKKETDRAKLAEEKNSAAISALQSKIKSV